MCVLFEKCFVFTKLCVFCFTKCFVFVKLCVFCLQRYVRLVRAMLTMCVCLQAYTPYLEYLVRVMLTMCVCLQAYTLPISSILCVLCLQCVFVCKPILPILSISLSWVPSHSVRKHAERLDIFIIQKSQWVRMKRLPLRPWVPVPPEDYPMMTGDTTEWPQVCITCPSQP